MGTTATAKSRGPSVIVPAGPQIGRCYAVVDIGTQTVDWNGRAKLQPKIRLSWEVPSIRVRFDTEDGKHVDKPAAVHAKFTTSLAENSNLRPFLESWRGRAFTGDELKGFDLKNVLGADALLTIVHKPKKDGDGFSVVVGSATKLMAGMSKPNQENKQVYYNVEMGRNEIFNSFPDWLQTEIAACAEWKHKSAHDDDGGQNGEGNDGGLTPEEKENLPF